MFAFGTDFIAGWELTRLPPLRRRFGCEDYSLPPARLAAVWRGSFGAEAQEHVAAAEVRLGSVVESVLFLNAGSGLDA